MALKFSCEFIYFIYFIYFISIYYWYFGIERTSWRVCVWEEVCIVKVYKQCLVCDKLVIKPTPPHTCYYIILLDTGCNVQSEIG